MKIFKAGARGSALSVAQAESAIRFLTAEVKGFRAELVTVETPGDRDLTTPISESPEDFFTRDLDEAVRAGKIDFAIHSAKDMPSKIADDLDWFWLPEREDPGDCIVLRRDAETVRKVGVSSPRRTEYALRRFPGAEAAEIRGAIDARLDQLAAGEYDAVIMAVAGLNRLFGRLPEMSDAELPFFAERIPLSELQPPEGQGVLAVVFKAGDRRMMKIRRQFVKAVRFTSGGTGDAGLMTVRGMRDLDEADVILYDDLTGLARTLGVKADDGRWQRVGKRCGAHSMNQDEISRLICNEARKGRRVVRLKGGDAGLFGRLAEETSALDALEIPYLVRPGVSALTAATTPNGISLTKRGEARGFGVFTPRSTGVKTPQVFFMASRVADEVLKKFPKDERYAMVYDACGPYERFETGVCGSPELSESAEPGILVTGFAGELKTRYRVLLTCSAAVMPRAVCAAEDRGWRAVEWPMIELRACEGLRELDVAGYNAIVLTSPSAVRVFFENAVCDRRRLPELWTCGAGTDAELRKYGVSSDLMPVSDFSAKGLIAAALARLSAAGVTGFRILRLRSAKAGDEVAESMRDAGADVDDVVLYDNVPVERDAVKERLPDSDAVFFASASAVESFIAQHTQAPLESRDILVMGEPTKSALPLPLRERAKKFSWI